MSGEPRPTVTWSKDNDDLRCLDVEVYDDESGYHVDIPQVTWTFLSNNLQKFCNLISTVGFGKDINNGLGKNIKDEIRKGATVGFGIFMNWMPLF